jgi:hypothetical protein
MSEMKDEPLTVQTLDAAKLLHYVKKKDLIQFMTPKHYAELESRLREQSLTLDDPTLKEIKTELLNNKNFIQQLRNSSVGEDAFTAYAENLSRLASIDRSKMKLIRSEMAEPRRRFVGCLATKIKPEDYSDCLANYDDRKYANVKIVPPALKTRVYQTTQNDALRNALSNTVSNGRLSSLPQGLKHYISSNPNEFRQYYEDRTREMNLIHMVVNSMTPQEKDRLLDMYSKDGTIPKGEFGKLFNVENAKKRIRGGNWMLDAPGGVLYRSIMFDKDNSDMLSDTASQIDELDEIEFD